MQQRWQQVRSRVRHVFFGAPYEPANHAALSPRGSGRDVRRVLIVVGTLWLSLVLFDNLARPWQRQPKSWRFFQGARELNEAANQARQPDFTHQQGDLAAALAADGLARQYAAGNDTARTYLETDGAGFRNARAAGPFEVVLCGDSFANNNSLADSLARATGLRVLNQAIEGRNILTMARWLETPPTAYPQVRVVVWESTERNALVHFRSLPRLRAALRRTAGQPFVWRESLLWPANLDLYLSGSSLLKPLLNKVKREMRWHLNGGHNEYVVLGRRDLPAGTAPMLYVAEDEAIQPEPTTPAQLDSIAGYVAAVSHELRQRGQELVFAIAPEKSLVYPNRLPAGLVARPNYITGLNQALRRRGVRVVDLYPGLHRAAQARPQQLYYYTSDTHWTPRGMGLAARLVADSLAGWHLLPAGLPLR